MPDPNTEELAPPKTLDERVTNGELRFFQNIPVSEDGQPLEFRHQTYIESLQLAYGKSAVQLLETWSWENESSQHREGQAGIYVDEKAIEEAHPRK